MALRRDEVLVCLPGDTKGKGILQTLPTVCFPSKNCVIGGTQNGTLYVFKFSVGSLMLVKTIEKAHKGAIFDLWCNQSTVMSGGKDGMLHRWRFSVKLGSVDVQYLRSSDVCKESGSTGAAIKSISHRENPPAVMVGFSNNKVFEVNEMSNETSLVVLGHAGGHSAKRLNKSLSLHPRDPDLMLSGGADGLLVVWNVKDKLALHHKVMDSPISSVQYSNSGGSFGVGLASGHVLVHHGDGDMEDSEFLAPEKQRSIAIHTLKFAPNDQFMAAGMDCNWIDVYDVAGKQCKLVATLKGHAGPVIEIDWYALVHPSPHVCISALCFLLKCQVQF